MPKMLWYKLVDGFEEIRAELIRVWDSALYIDTGYEKIWIPISQIRYGCKYSEASEGEMHTFEIATWLCEEKGLS